MTVITPPEKFEIHNQYSVFLAGSIESDTAEPWQNLVIEALVDMDVMVLNPRRASWDSNWKQDINNPKFKEQVSWELKALEEVQRIVMYFDPSTKSPISLLELGLFAQSGKMLVCCPEGFWRKGNVDIVCERYHIRQVQSLQDLIHCIKQEPL
ncbi:nucleoside 2-deoxyribosyltransferase domain-containing protein [Spongiimicrobium salis]|uniref:nucleoside 2-deoxyribosyltransferase domain-containing protein n=1 Tax=Spongiimicrobium salis TaxID=1667022 RepID=UPI00374D4D37